MIAQRLHELSSVTAREYERVFNMNMHWTYENHCTTASGPVSLVQGFAHFPDLEYYLGFRRNANSERIGIAIFFLTVIVEHTIDLGKGGKVCRNERRKERGIARSLSQNLRAWLSFRCPEEYLLV